MVLLQRRGASQIVQAHFSISRVSATNIRVFDVQKETKSYVNLHKPTQSCIPPLRFGIAQVAQGSVDSCANAAAKAALEADVAVSDAGST